MPELLEKQGAGHQIMTKFDLDPKTERDTVWDDLLEKVRLINTEQIIVNIAIVGKYTGLLDSYLSVIKALEHSAINCGRKLNLVWIESTRLEDPDSNAWEELKSVDGILVPGGFGERGAQGKMDAIKYARENKVPYLGVCLGMQLAIIEFCRNVLGIKDADSEEFNQTCENKVIIFMPEISKITKGGTMRLGARHTIINSEESLAFKIYNGNSSVYERHRHRYEFNIKYKSMIEEQGLIFTGEDSNKERMEIVELLDHPFFIGTQYHPEFTSKPFSPNPVFFGFVKASAKVFEYNSD